MEKTLHDMVSKIGERVIGFLPNLVAGIVLIALGCFLGWFAKRVIIQLAMLLRLERYLTRFRWGKDFSRADVRHGFYSFLGNIAFLVVLLIFVGNAFRVWQLATLSDLLERGILFLPKVIISSLVFGFGWLISTWVAASVRSALRKENIFRGTLAVRFIKGVLLLFFSAMALTELGVAPAIVTIGFATILITIGALTVVVTAVGGREFIKKLLEFSEEE
jgi:hypothetical protein